MAAPKPAPSVLPPGTRASRESGVDWVSLKLAEPILKVIQEVLKFDALTPVQSATIPHFLDHKDVAVEVRHHATQCASHLTSKKPRTLNLSTF